MPDQAAPWPEHGAGVEGYGFRLWGRFSVKRLADGFDVTPRGRKTRALLACLLIEGEPVHRERLAGLLWSERGQAQAHASLRQCLLELRDLVPVLDVERRQLHADPAVTRTDLGDMLDAAAQGDADRLAGLLELAGGGLLEDLDGIDPAFDQWLRTVRAARTGGLLTASQACCRRALDEGRIEPAVRLARSLQAIDPLDEGLARLAMEAGHRAGKQDAVQRIYDRLAADLQAELGVAPSPDTRALHDRLIGAPGAAAAPPAAPAEARPHAAPASAAGKPGLASWRWWVAATVLILFAAGAFAAWRLLDRPGSGAEPASLAVLPFRNLSAGEDHFAEGVAEEILTQLSREPQFRVAGRTSSWLFRDTADAREIGRRLDVDYVLEGNVRQSNGRVRVDVALVDTDDGMRMWSRAFQGRLDDIFTIQNNIGRAVAGSLRRQLVRAPLAGPLTTRGDVYNLYLTARSLMRERTPAKLETAVTLLRRAVQLDPDYAPAWASLGAAVKMHWWYAQRFTGGPAPIAEASGYVQRALALAPDLAEAHAALAMIRDNDPRGLPHLERAVRLDPNNAEAWYWLYQARLARLEFEDALHAVRRTAAIDPFWVHSSWADNLAEDMGFHDEALRLRQRIAAAHPDPFARETARSAIARSRRDLSSSYRHARRASEIASPDSRQLSGVRVAALLFRLGFPDQAQSAAGAPDFITMMMRGDAPSLAELRARFPAPADFWSSEETRVMVPRLWLNAGRGRDLILLYDRAFRSPEAMAAQHPGGSIEFLRDVPSIAVALRDAGRAAEAARLLAIADRIAAAARRRGRVPASFEAACARIWAVQGRRAEALAALERAVGAGWRDDEMAVLPPFAEEPAFRGLRGEPRLRRLDALIQGELARERRELLAAGI